MVNVTLHMSLIFVRHRQTQSSLISEFHTRGLHYAIGGYIYTVENGNATASKLKEMHLYDSFIKKCQNNTEVRSSQIFHSIAQKRRAIIKPVIKTATGHLKKQLCLTFLWFDDW